MRIAFTDRSRPLFGGSSLTGNAPISLITALLQIRGCCHPLCGVWGRYQTPSCGMPQLLELGCYYAGLNPLCGPRALQKYQQALADFPLRFGISDQESAHFSHLLSLDSLLGSLRTVAMNHPNDKAEESRVEHADMGTREADSDPAAPTLKITRDGYWENKKGILMCLIVSLAFFEFGLDQASSLFLLLRKNGI